MADQQSQSRLTQQAYGQVDRQDHRLARDLDRRAVRLREAEAREVEADHQLLELLRELLRLRLTSPKAALTTLTRLSLAGHREVEGLLISPRPLTLTALTLPPLREEDRELADRLLPSRELELGEEERPRKSRSTIRCRFP